MIYIAKVSNLYSDSVTYSCSRQGLAMPILLFDNQNPDNCLLPNSFSREDLLNLLNIDLDDPQDSAFVIVNDNSDQGNSLVLGLQGCNQKKLLKIHLAWGEEYGHSFLLIHRSHLCLRDLLDEHAWTILSKIGGTARWIHKWNQSFVTAKAIEDDDGEIMLGANVCYKQGLLERGFMQEIINLHADLNSLYSYINMFADEVAKFLSDLSPFDKPFLVDRLSNDDLVSIFNHFNNGEDNVVELEIDDEGDLCASRLTHIYIRPLPGSRYIEYWTQIDIPDEYLDVIMEYCNSEINGRYMLKAFARPDMKQIWLFYNLSLHGRDTVEAAEITSTYAWFEDVSHRIITGI